MKEAERVTECFVTPIFKESDPVGKRPPESGPLERVQSGFSRDLRRHAHPLAGQTTRAALRA